MPRPAQVYKQNRLQQLRGFCYTAQAGSVSKAAERLFLSQPSVTLQIQALEREFKTTLFERRGPRIALTPEGRTLYELALPLVEEFDALQATFAERRGLVERGQLHVAAGESTILYILPRFVKQFVEDYPNIELKLHNVTGRDGLAMVRAGDVEFSVGSMLEVPDDIEFEPLFRFDPYLITPLGHPLADKRRVTIEEVARYPLILPPRHVATWRVIDLVFQQHNLNYRVQLEAGGWEVIKKYVELGLGVSVLTDVCLTGHEQLAFVPLRKYFPQRTYGVVVRRGKFLSPQAKRFIELMARGRTTPRKPEALRVKGNGREGNRKDAKNAKATRH